jgi:hypothetical protein
MDSPAKIAPCCLSKALSSSLIRNSIVVDKKFNCTDLVQGVVEGLILRYQVRSFRGLVGSQGFIGTVG